MNTQLTAVMPTLQTDRLMINQLTSDDISAFYAYRTHPEILRYQGEFPRNEEEVREFLAMQNQIPFGTTNHWYQFAVRLMPDSTFIGDLGLHFYSPFIPQVEIAYSIMPSFQRKGYAKESVQALLAYCFDKLQINIISAVIDTRNIASRNLLIKFGFKRMAFRPHACYLRGEWCDEEDFALYAHNYMN